MAQIPNKKNTFGIPISNALYVVFEQNGKNAKTKKLAISDYDESPFGSACLVQLARMNVT